MGPHQRFMLVSQVELIEVIERQLEEIDEEVERWMRPFEAALDLIDEIPGIARHGAEQILAVNRLGFWRPGVLDSRARAAPS